MLRPITPALHHDVLRMGQLISLVINYIDVAGPFNNRGVDQLEAFERTGELSALNEGILLFRQAAYLTPHGHAEMPGRLNNLGGSFIRRFERTGELSDISDAIAVLQTAINLTPQDHANLSIMLSNLGGALTCCFIRTGELSDISDAITIQQKAVDLTPVGHAELPSHLTNLANSLTHRFVQTGEYSDIVDAIEIQQKAVDLTPQSHPNLPAMLNILGGSYTYRFERKGELSDIAYAIEVRQKAVDLSQEGHANLPDYLSNLGNSLTCRFERTGDLSDIADAIALQQKGVNLTPQGHSNLPAMLENLGGSFSCRFERTGELSDLEEAIAAERKAVDLTSLGHANLPGRLSNLGYSLTCRFERTGELLDNTEAIAVRQKAVQLVPQNHANLPSYLNNLGNSFIRRFEQTGELADIANAIAFQREAVDRTPQGHADLPGRLNNLGGSFTCRFQRTGEVSDIADAIAVGQKAVDLTPQGHAGLPAMVETLGVSFYHLFISSGELGDLHKTLSCYKAAATSTAGPPRTKLSAARRWASTLIQHRPESPDIITAFDAALGLLAIIAGLEQTVKGRYTQLGSTSGLALEAAAAACALERADKAMEWLEQGRCLVWNQLNQLRTPLDNLRIHDQDLAQDIANVSKQLEHIGSSRVQSRTDMSLSQKISLEDEARVHLGLAKKWDALLRKARAIPGFESFLMPLPCSTIMLHLPRSGPTIIIIVDQRRCDSLALLTELDEPLHIPLPNFSIEKANKYRSILDSQLRARQLRAREVEVLASTGNDLPLRAIRSVPVGKRGEDPPVHRVLRGLWEEVVKPVLDALGFSRIDHTEIPPRVWWCPTGPLSFLPLHAAGIYRGSDTVSVFDYVVSSYTPTVNAITDRVKNHGPGDDTASGLFLTSQPSVKGVSPIPGTTSEVRSIFEQAMNAGVRVQKLEGDEMSVADCIARMQDFSSVHLACHGSQNAAEPLQSRFLFHQGPLELGTILKSNLKNAELAFLSACQTSTGQEELSDEAVHLAAGMLAAGYRRVIGTMWSIGDAPAQQVATAFYEYLFSRRNGTTGATFDDTLSAVALHHATQQLRLTLDNSERSLLTWIPFVHFGL
ncbi:CHAT domain-containing protein [Ephemerocybe angulata]|uniref:CHAT domain-containing protein n=1 Tax=Ephemerocybe angulata TaxID=980116 RepID=A0A8H6HRI2_9AGAR|nr:CHAT domain-containing protein [Tulosesus angulatus]